MKRTIIFLMLFLPTVANATDFIDTDLVYGEGTGFVQFWQTWALHKTQLESELSFLADDDGCTISSGTMSCTAGFVSTSADGTHYGDVTNTIAITAAFTEGNYSYLTDRFWIANGSDWVSRYIFDSSMTIPEANIDADIARDSEVTSAITTERTTTATLTNKTIDADDNIFSDMPYYDCFILSDETTDLTTGTAKLSFRAPYAITLTDIRINVVTAPTGAIFIVDLNEAGTTVLSTKATIDVSELTSVTAATPPVISDSAIADDALMTWDIDQIGSTVAGAGLKACVYGTRDY